MQAVIAKCQTTDNQKWRIPSAILEEWYPPRGCGDFILAFCPKLLRLIEVEEDFLVQGVA